MTELENEQTEREKLKQEIISEDSKIGNRLWEIFSLFINNKEALGIRKKRWSSHVDDWIIDDFRLIRVGVTFESGDIWTLKYNKKEVVTIDESGYIYKFNNDIDWIEVLHHTYNHYHTKFIEIFNKCKLYSIQNRESFENIEGFDELL